ncbi:MAG: serine/threonine protein kinase [Myxococcales bacterium]|nr:serine/threonine protein kinase [Myxococcales bacterium]
MLQCAECLTRYADGTQACPLDGGVLHAVAPAGDYGQGVTPHLSTPMPIGRSTVSPGPVASDDPLIEEVLGGKLKVQRRIGQGGMGTVYVAEHLILHKPVAVKVLSAQLALTPDLVQRLHSEARLAASISSPHIVEVFDVGATPDGRPYVEMELLIGESLAQRLARCSALAESDTLRIGEQLATALAAAHESGILHRDIKPENIFLCARDGEDFVKLLDFGIAKAVRITEEPRLTRTGAILGTPLYMSPEQVRGDLLDPRADVYGLGVVLYECLTGSVPHCAASYLSVVAKILTESAEPPSRRCPDRQISPDLEYIVMRAMARDREERYPTMGALLSDLHRFQNGLMPLTMPGPVTQVPGIVPGSLGRALWRTLLGGGLLLLVMGLFGSRLWWPGQRPATVPATVEPAVAPPQTPAAVAVPAVPAAVDAKAVEPSIRRAGAADRAEVKHSLPVNRRAPSRRSSPAHKAQPFDSDPLSEEQAPNPFVVTPDLGRSR